MTNQIETRTCEHCIWRMNDYCTWNRRYVTLWFRCEWFKKGWQGKNEYTN